MSRLDRHALSLSLLLAALVLMHPAGAPAAPADAKAAADAKAPASAKAPADAKTAPASGFNRLGNVLIADRFNNRVIELDYAGNIVWSFGKGPSDLSGASPIGPRSVERTGDLTLIAASGAPAGSEPGCPQGCPDNRVLLVDRAGKVVWQYGDLATAGGGPGQLDRPARARMRDNGNILIADQGNHRVIEVGRKDKKIVWQHGTTGAAGFRAGELNQPADVAEMVDGNLLIADALNNRAIVVGRDHAVVATYTASGTTGEVSAASVAPDTGNILISDLEHKRVCEIDPSDHPIWTQWTYTMPGSTGEPKVACVYRLRRGDMIICDQLNHRVLRGDAMGNPIATYGNVNRAGFGTRNASEGLNAPYDADVIGD